MTGNISPVLGIARLIAVACSESDILVGSARAVPAANSVLIRSLREIIVCLQFMLSLPRATPLLGPVSYGDLSILRHLLTLPHVQYPGSQDWQRFCSRNIVISEILTQSFGLEYVAKVNTRDTLENSRHDVTIACFKISKAQRKKALAPPLGGILAIMAKPGDATVIHSLRTEKKPAAYHRTVPEPG